MDVYDVSSTPDYFRIDDLLDLSNEDIFSSSSSSSVATSSAAAAADLHPLPQPSTPSQLHHHYPLLPSSLSSDFTDQLSLPSDDVAELEWLSRFVDDSFTDFPPNSIVGTINVRPDAPFSGKARTKRFRGSAANWTPSPEPESLGNGRERPMKKEASRALSPTPEGGVRRCTHCASEKTPQWRTGPLGPKTLCNACGVRYKSGRLVPEYRPAASPTFVLTQHSNSHRKVLELRRQKEVQRQQQQQEGVQPQLQQQHVYDYHHNQDFRVC